jgi:DNA polymerase
MTLDPRRRALWHAMRLGAVWQTRGAGPAAAAPTVEPLTPEVAPPTPEDAPATPAHAPAAIAFAPMATAGEPQPGGDGDRKARIARMDWEPLQAAVAACTACELCRTRRQTVFGTGHRQAHWLLAGEAPGAEEDERGEPFVGQAGRLLDNMLEAVGRSRRAQDPAAAVYIANVLKCRPPANRNPQPQEVALCEPFLKRQVQLVSPRVVLIMGRFAAQSLLGSDASIAQLRGRVHAIDLGGRTVPAIVTYHPAYLLRNLADKSKSWADLCLARQVGERGG